MVRRMGGGGRRRGWNKCNTTHWAVKQSAAPPGQSPTRDVTGRSGRGRVLQMCPGDDSHLHETWRAGQDAGGSYRRVQVMTVTYTRRGGPVRTRAGLTDVSR